MIQIRPVHRAIRGATLSLFLDVFQDADTAIDGTETVRAVAKKVNRPQDRSPGDAAPDAFEFSVTWVPAAGEQLAGWHLEASAADIEAQDAGYYLTDVRIDMGGGRIEQASALAIDIPERVTEAA